MIPDREKYIEEEKNHKGIETNKDQWRTWNIEEALFEKMMHEQRPESVSHVNWGEEPSKYAKSASQE